MATTPSFARTLDRRSLLAGAAAGLAASLAGCGGAPAGQPGIYRVRVSTGELSRVVDVAARPAWSPDGRFIAWSADTGLWVAASEGSQRQRLLGVQSPSPPAFSPDGRRVAVMDPARHTLRIIGTNGRDAAEFAVGQSTHLSGDAPAVQRNIPAWSPDGKSILATGWDGNGDAIFRIDPSTGDAAEISNATVSNMPFHGGDENSPPRAGANAVWPDWSPDGAAAWAAIPQVAGAPGGIWVAAGAGSAPRRISDAVPSFGPLWSPDGKLLLAVTPTSKGAALVTVNAASGDMSTLPGPAGSIPVDAAWSPDGGAVAYSDGAAIRILTLADRSVRDLPGTPLSDLSPAWSPDGQWIAFRAEQDQFDQPALPPTA